VSKQPKSTLRKAAGEIWTCFIGEKYLSMMKVLAAVFIIISLTLSGCAKVEPSSATSPSNKIAATSSGNMTLGPVTSVVLANATISPSGGTIKISEPGNPLSGLEVKVPAGSYSETRQIKISYSPIEKQPIAAEIHSLTPLIILDNGGGYSSSMMQVKIPVKVPSGQFAMGFSYDAKKGKLKGLPVVKKDTESITLATQYLGPVVVGSINELLLNENIPSSFKPGIDDWQFTNYGSYVAPNGHCAGQSISALWYFLNKPDGSDVHLYRTYDNNGNQPKTPDFWQDDSVGYRFASMIQNDINWDSVSMKMFGDLFSGQGDIWGTTDADTMKNFAYAMMQSHGEPQEVVIYSLSGSAHAMVVYAVDKDGLSVADPNYPGDTTRRIKFSNGRFQPYNSGANADDIAKGRGTVFEIIRYVPQDSYIDQAKMQNRWTELKTKTIGNDKFPVHQNVWVDDAGQKHELTDGYKSPNRLIKLQIQATDTNLGGFIYRDGKSLTPNSNGKIELLPGNNKLGIYQVGKVGGDWKYIDFKYINVSYTETSPTPSPSASPSPKPFTSPTASTIPATWKMQPPKLEDKSGNKNANREFIVAPNSITFNYHPPQSDSKGLLLPNTVAKMTWELPPEILTTGQVFDLSFKGNGTLVKTGQNDLSIYDAVGVSVKLTTSGLNQTVSRVGSGWNGYNPDPARDLSLVTWHSGQMLSGGQPFWGVNQTYKLTPQPNVTTISITLTVSGGNGAGIDGGGIITYQWQKQ
jgi:hypothetical protein